MRRIKQKIEDWMGVHLLERVWLRVILWSCGVPLAALLVAVLFPDLGDDVPPTFYAVTAQVIPVLLLAFFVEEGSQASRISEDYRREFREIAQMEQEEYDAKGWAYEKDEWMEGIRATEKLFLDFAWVASSVMGTRAAFGEALSLYALATGETSTFLLAGTTLSILMMFRGLSRTFLSRMRPAWATPVEQDE